MNVVTYRGEKPELTADPNFKALLEILSKQLELIKRFGTACVLVDAGTKLGFQNDVPPSPKDKP